MRESHSVFTISPISSGTDICTISAYQLTQRAKVSSGTDMHYQCLSVNPEGEGAKQTLEGKSNSVTLTSKVV